MKIYGARLLDGVLSNTKVSQPNSLAFVDIHDRDCKDGSAETVPAKYEVWCPGRRLARAYLNQCHIAAQTLVHQHNVRFAPSTSEEFQVFPHEISVYMKQFLQDRVDPILQRYSVR
jgi:hypothetical protein